MMNHDVVVPVHELLHEQDCIMCSFENREELDKNDLKEIKNLGLSFRGKNEWPLFRRFEPGYYPWYITPEECVFLTICLEQVITVVADQLAGKIRLNLEAGQSILRHQVKTNDTLEWKSNEVMIPIPEIAYDEMEITDPELIDKLNHMPKEKKTSLQIDLRYLSSPAQNEPNEKPIYPRMLLITNSDTGYIYHGKFVENPDDVGEVLDEVFHFLLHVLIPQEIQIRSEYMEGILGDLCNKINVQLVRLEELDKIEFVLNVLAIYANSKPKYH